MSGSDEERCDWRLQNNSLTGQLWYMYQNDIDADLEVYTVHEGNKNSFTCHKLMLIRISSVFQTLIENSDQRHGSLDSITIFANPIHFDEILRYAYTDNVELSSFQEALEIKNLCTRYAIEALTVICDKYLATAPLTVDNFWDLMEGANAGRSMTSKLSKFLSKHTLECIDSDKFETCSQASLLKLLRKANLNIDSEVQLLQAVLKWANFQNEGNKLDPEISRYLLGPCLEHIRFLALTPAEFSEHVVGSGLFSIEDALKILVNLSSPNQMDLPDNICQDSSSRVKPNPSENALDNAKFLSMSSLASTIDSCESGSSDKKKKVAKNKSTEILNVGRNQILCFRAKCPTMQVFDSVLYAPSVVEVEFKVNQDVYLAGVKIMAQVSPKKITEAGTYAETMHVSVVEIDAGKQPVAFHTYIAPVKPGEGSVFDVNFKTPGLLKCGKMYLLKMNIKTNGGSYVSPVRSMVVYVEDLIIVNFGSYEKFPHSGIVHSLVLQKV